MGADAGHVYRALAPAVLGYLRATGTAEPEDRLGEVFLHVARDLGRFRDAGDPAAVRRWVFTIARNRAIDAGRAARRRPALAPVAVPDRPAPPAPDDVDGVDGVVLDALRALTPVQREVVALRFVADLGLAEVARLTRRSVGAVKALQHRGLEAMRSKLAASSWAPEAL